MSLPAGIAVLALAVVLGGIVAARWRERGHRAMPALRTFAVVAAVAVALLHLLPEAIAEVGWPVLIATAVGFIGPAALERILPGQNDPAHKAPTTALAMGYAAVIVHQAGEGAAVAALSRSGALSPSIVVAIAAHTVPLAMVVAIRVFEVRGAQAGTRRAVGLALAGVAGATIMGATLGSSLGASKVGSIEPWILGAVAGLLLHALSHDAFAAPPQRLRGRLIDAVAGWAGLLVAALGAEDGEWLAQVPLTVRVGGIVLAAAMIAARSFWPRREGSAAAHERHVH